MWWWLPGQQEERGCTEGDHSAVTTLAYSRALLSSLILPAPALPRLPHFPPPSFVVVTTASPSPPLRPRQGTHPSTHTLLLPVQGEAALVGVANSVWRASPQRAAMAVDRLMTLRLVSAEAIVGWVFDSEGVRVLGDESLSGAAWEILYGAVNKTIARVQVGGGRGRGLLGGCVCCLGGEWSSTHACSLLNQEHEQIENEIVEIKL